MKYVILIIFALTSCAAPKVAKPIHPPMPPLPWAAVQSKGDVPRLGELPAPRQARITLAWNCAPSPLAAYWVTGLEASTNFTNWQEVARIPYVINPRVTLTNRPPYEFYRAFTSVR